MDGIRIGKLRALAAAAALLALPAQAQITASGLGTAVNQAGNAWSITAGTQRGGNLFHSFGHFNVLTGHSATFSGAADVTNIIGRVTGGSASTIDGMLRSTIAGANLFLINPSGVLFGPNASLDISGSFHASSADYLKLGTTGRFDAANPGASVLATAPPSAFGFMGPAPAALSVQGSSLAVPAGKTLSLVGGRIRLANAALSAPAGRLNLASAAGAGEITPGPAGIAATSAPLGTITATNSTLHADSTPGQPAGSIYIRGGKLAMSNTATYSDNSDSSSGGNIDIRISGEMSLDDSFISTWSLGFGDGGDINVRAGRLALVNGGELFTDAFSTGRGGSLSVTATGSIAISGRNAGNFLSGLLALNESSGGSGSISLSAPVITMSDGGIVTAETHGTGAAGDVNVAAGRLALDHATITATTFNAGRGGNIGVQAERLNLASGATISSRTFATGNGGDISITASESAAISGGGGLFSSAGPSGSGDTGSISLVTPLLTMNDARIFTTSRLAGNAGDIHFEVARLNFTNGAQANTTTYGAGRGGNLTVSASESISMSGHSSVYISGLVSSTAGSGNGGSIRVTAPVLLLDGGIIATGTLLSGKAGTATVEAGRADLVNGGRVDASTFAFGPGGNINLHVSGPLTISGSRDAAETEAILREFVRVMSGDLINDFQYAVIRPAFGDFASSGVFSRAVFSGTGGAINIAAGNVTVRDGGRINAATSGTGNAGTITLDAGAFLKLFNGGAITTQADIADGGDILIIARDLVHLVDSRITTSVGAAEGSGGNITIDPVLVVLDNSQIIASAVGGDGGNIRIVSQIYLESGDSVVNASSQKGISGTITTTAPNADFIAGLGLLTSGFFDASSQLRQSCAARGGAANSFTGIGRGGLPASPGQMGFGSYTGLAAEGSAAGGGSSFMLAAAGVPGERISCR